MRTSPGGMRSMKDDKSWREYDFPDRDTEQNPLSLFMQDFLLSHLVNMCHLCLCHVHVIGASGLERL